jgi:predicted DNA-binding antitoxin AbrB/MazE fold protein
MMEIIEAVYENGVLIPLKKPKLKEHSKVIIKIIDEGELDKLLDSLVVEKVKSIDYKKLKEAYYESL